MKRSRSQSPAQMLRYASVIVRELADVDNDEHDGKKESNSAAEATSNAQDNQEESKRKRRSSGGGVLIIDVRTRAEFKSGHLQNAIHVKTKQFYTVAATGDKVFGSEQKQHLFKKLQHKIAGAYSPSTYIIVYCSDGERAGIAKTFLETLGFRNVICLGGLDIPPLDAIAAGKETDDAFQMCTCTNF